MSISQRRMRVLQISSTVAVVACAVLGAVKSSAGIQGSGLRMFAAVGPITAMASGSVTVGGVQYSTSGAQVEIDGNAGSASQLHPGDVVSIDGLGSPGRGRFARASSMSFSANIRGAVSGVDPSSGAIFVLGQTVHVSSSTRFDAATQAGGLEALQNGTVIEVSGFADAAGNVLATRVGTPGNSAAERVVGTVRNLNPSQRTFDINALVVSYAGAEVDGTLAEGTSVAVQGSHPSTAGTLVANRVDVEIPLQASPGTEGRIEGLITNLASADYFEVGGQPVSLGAHTQLNLHVPLGLDVEVKVTGVFDGNRTLVASKVQTRH